MRLVTTTLQTGLATLLAVSLGGCATTSNEPLICAAIGGGLGAVGGGIGGADHADDNDNWEGAAIGVAGAVAGAGIGYLVCALLEEEPKPAPKKAPASAPAPAPAPVPAAAPAPKPDPCAGLVRLEGVTFESDKADVRPPAAAILDETVTALQGCSEKRVRIDAYTDSSGSDVYNQGLSQRRADSVRAYLIQQGIAADRIESYGLGESNPVASNETSEGRAENRRVELQPIE